MESLDEFAAMSGLLAAWDGLRHTRRNGDVDGFQRWLSEQGFDDLANTVAQNTVLSEQILEVLSGQHSELLSAIRDLTSKFSRSDQTGADPVSAEAIAILCQIKGVDASTVTKLNTMNFKGYILHGEAGQQQGDLEVIDGCFYDQDIDELVEHGYLSVIDGVKRRKWCVTRKGRDFIKQ